MGRNPIRIVPETQPIHCLYNLYCEGGMSKWRVESTPVSLVWLHLCDDCARELVAAIPPQLLAALTPEQMATLRAGQEPAAPAPGQTQAAALATVSQYRDDGEFMDRLALVLEGARPDVPDAPPAAATAPAEAPASRPARRKS